MAKNGVLTTRRIFWFWVPLAAMWLIMSVEQPSITAVISRLPQARENLAAFGLTFAFALIVESPVIMLLTAGTALSGHRQSFDRLMRFTHLISAALLVLHLLFVLTPLYAYVLRDWIGAPEEIIGLSRTAFLLTFLWTPMIAYRRLWEGVMIRYGHPDRVTRVIVVRMVATIGVLLLGLWLGRWPGAYVGGFSLSVGVSVGAVAAYLLARGTIRHEIPETTSRNRPLTWPRLGRFYGPLALTSLITMIGLPILSFGLARAPLPLDSLAVWPVVSSLLFIGRSVGIAFQEVVVALLQDAKAYEELRRFGFRLAGGASGIFLLLVVTPGAALWYREIAGLAPDLVALAILPTAIMVPVPGLNALIAWKRGVLVRSEETGTISLAVGISMLVLLAIMAAGPFFAAVPGAVLAASAMTLSLSAEFGLLWWRSRPVVGRIATVGLATGD